MHALKSCDGDWHVQMLHLQGSSVMKRIKKFLIEKIIFHLGWSI
jgi:hypothetical protein